MAEVTSFLREVETFIEDSEVTRRQWEGGHRSARVRKGYSSPSGHMRAVSSRDVTRDVTRDSLASEEGSAPSTRPHSINNPTYATQAGAVEDLNMFRRRSSLRRSARAALSSAKVRNGLGKDSDLTPQLTEVPGWDSGTLFVGRDWLYREMEQALSSTDLSRSRGVLIVGSGGTGKTSLLLNIIRHSPAAAGPLAGPGPDAGGEYEGRTSRRLLPHSSSQPHLSSMRSGLGSGLQQSMPALNDGEHAAAKRLGARVVAWHVCQADKSPTCLVPEFVHSLAAHLAKHLQAYGRLLAQSGEGAGKTDLRGILSLRECVRSPGKALLKGILEPLATLRQQGRLSPHTSLIILDSLNEAEFHRPDYGHTLASFLTQHISRFPTWLKLVATVRTSHADLTQFLPLHVVHLDQLASNPALQQDLMTYTQTRLSSSPSLRTNAAVTDAQTQLNFASHLLGLARGSFLYTRLCLDLIETGQLVIKSASFRILPQKLAELFLLRFNLKFPSLRLFEQVSPILSVCLASLQPLSDDDIYDALNAGYVTRYVTREDFEERMASLDELLIKLRDGKRMFVHSALREWLVRREEGEAAKFTCDLRTGHALIALKLSRTNYYLGPDRTLELAHHILKAHIYKMMYRERRYSSRHMQTMWTCLSSESLSAALLAHRNLCSPNIKVSRLILLSGANPNARSELQDRAPGLCVAAAHGFLELAQLLLEFGARVDATSDAGVTALCHGAAAGHVAIMRLLLEHGAKVGQTDNKGECALIHAARAGQVESMAVLLGADWSAAHEANIVSRSYGLQQALVAAAHSGNTGVIDYLLTKHGDEVQLARPDTLLGETALSAAAVSGHGDTVTHVLRLGADVSCPNAKTYLPLHSAAKHGHWQVVESLLSAGASLESTDGHGRTALMLAAMEGHLGTLEVLLTRGASVSAVEKEGLTALCWACLKGQVTCVRSLADRGADIAHMDESGRTPLHLAAFAGDAQVLHFLLEQGADLEHTDHAGMRPLDRAISAGSAAAVSVCLRRGARLTVSTWQLASDRPDILLMLLGKLAQDGNTLYKKTRIKEAAHRYSYALKKVPWVENTGEKNFRNCSPDEKKAFREIRLNLLLNLSRCKRKTNDFTGAIELATLAIQMKMSSYEAYYARARAVREAGRPQDAVNDLIEALKLSPQNRELQRLLQRVKDECRTHSASQGSRTANQNPPARIPANRTSQATVNQNGTTTSRGVHQGKPTNGNVEGSPPRPPLPEKPVRLTNGNTGEERRHWGKPAVSAPSTSGSPNNNYYVPPTAPRGASVANGGNRVVFHNVREETAL